MMQKAWSSTEEVSCFIHGHPSKFKVTRDKQMPIFSRFRTVTTVSIHQWLWNDVQSLKKKRTGDLFLFRSSVKFQGHRIEHFRTVTLVWIHWWLWNDAQSLTWYERGALWFFEVIHWISRSHGPKNRRFKSNIKQDYLLGRSYQIPQICLVCVWKVIKAPLSLLSNVKYTVLYRTGFCLQSTHFIYRDKAVIRLYLFPLLCELEFHFMYPIWLAKIVPELIFISNHPNSYTQNMFSAFSEDALTPKPKYIKERVKT